MRRTTHFITVLPYLLGSTNPCLITIHMEPFSTQSKRVSLLYLLLPPRSALESAARGVTPNASSHVVYCYTETLRLPTHRRLACFYDDGKV